MYLNLDLRTELFISEQAELILENKILKKRVTFTIKTNMQEELLITMHEGINLDKDIFSDIDKTIISMFKQDKDFFILLDSKNVTRYFYLKNIINALSINDPFLIDNLYKSLNETRVIVYSSTEDEIFFNQMGIANVINYKDIDTLFPSDIIVINFDELLKEDLIYFKNNIQCFFSYARCMIGPIVFQSDQYDIEQICNKAKQENYNLMFLNCLIRNFLINIILHLQSGIYKQTFKNLALPISSLFKIDYPSLEINIKNLYNYSIK